MDAWDMAKVVLRRWWVFLPIALITMMLTSSADARITPEYQTTASVLLVGPFETVPQVEEQVVRSINPYLNQGIATTATVMQVILQNRESRLKVIQAGGSPSYSIGVQTRTPIMNIRVATGDRALTLKTATIVADLLRSELQARQEAFKAPKQLHITTQTLDSVGSVSEVRNGLKQIRVVIMALGLGLAIAASLLINALLMLLSRRKAADAATRAEALKTPPRSTVG